MQFAHFRSETCLQMTAEEDFGLSVFGMMDLPLTGGREALAKPKSFLRFCLVSSLKGWLSWNLNWWAESPRDGTAALWLWESF